jgi:hypothetical protein
MRRLPHLFVPTVLAIVALAGCGSDRATGPGITTDLDDPACVKGELASSADPVATNGRLGAASCVGIEPLTLRAMRYDAYTLPVQAGVGYVLTARAPDTSIANYLMEVWGGTRTTAQLLAIDDNAGRGANGHDPQIYFVAPQTGSYALHVLALHAPDTSLYALTSRTCPVRAAIAGSAAFTAASQELQASDCILNVPPFPVATGDSAHVAFYTVHMEANTEREITVASADFNPSFEITGPGFSTCSFFIQCGGVAGATGTTTTEATTILRVGIAGEYTLVVGAQSFAQVGRFTLTVGAIRALTAQPRVVSSTIR